jgi:hypothetical protein
MYVTKNGGTSLNGDPSVYTSDGGGRWTCQMTVPLVDLDGNTSAQQIKKARASIEATRGGSLPIILTYMADAEAPYPSVGTTITITAAAASVRATTLTITVTSGGTISGGEVFSINHGTVGPRLYTITAVSGSTITLGRPLREAITNGTALEFVTPTSVMRLMNPTEAMQAITPPYQGFLTLQFQECRAP